MTTQHTTQPTESSDQPALEPAQRYWNESKASDRLRRSVKKGGVLKVAEYYWSTRGLQEYVGRFVIVLKPKEGDQVVYVYTQEGEHITNAVRGKRYS